MKWMVVMVLFAVANAAPYEGDDIRICTPGTTFKIDCNTCFCTPNGRNYGCTKMACFPLNDEQNIEENIIPLYRKREAKYDNSRKKRATNDMYEDDQQFFVDQEERAPLTVAQQEEIGRLTYQQRQQSYYDRVQLQQDLAREREELAQQQEELEQQQDDMQSQLEYQQEQDAQQWEEDARQQAYERQQLLLEQQRQLLEQQQQQKQDEQYYKKGRNFSRKNALKSVYAQ